MISDWQQWGVRFGDWLNLLGLALSLLAAHQAWRAAREARNASTHIQRFRATVDLGQLTKAIEHLRTFNRSGIAKESLLFLYGDLAKSIALQCNSEALSENDRKILKETLSEVREMEATIEKIGTKSRELDVATLNERLAARMDVTFEILSRLEKTLTTARA